MKDRLFNQNIFISCWILILLLILIFWEFSISGTFMILSMVLFVAKNIYFSKQLESIKSNDNIFEQRKFISLFKKVTIGLFVCFVIVYLSHYDETWFEKSTRKKWKTGLILFSVCIGFYSSIYKTDIKMLKEELEI